MGIHGDDTDTDSLTQRTFLTSGLITTIQLSGCKTANFLSRKSLDLHVSYNVTSQWFLKFMCKWFK